MLSKYLASWTLILAVAGAAEGARVEVTETLKSSGGKPGYAALTISGLREHGISIRGSERNAFVLTQNLGEGKFRVLTRGYEFPSEWIVEQDGTREILRVDWSRARHSPALADVWSKRLDQEIAQWSGVLQPFRLHVERRLAGDDESRLQNFLRAQNMRRQSRAQRLDLITGATAIEESLQLERLRGTGRDRKQTSTIPISSVSGVTVKSHPWEKMLAGRRPEAHEIETFLPADQYSFEAASFAAMLELADWLDDRGSPIISWLEEKAEDAGAKDRLEMQLCLPATELSRRFGPLVIRRVAATGGDPFLREGADLTIIFELKSRRLFLANLEKNRIAAALNLAGCRKIELDHRSHRIEGLVTEDRVISSYSTVVGNYALVSNSLEGLKNVLDTRDGLKSSHKDLLGRRYIRTLLPRSDREDVFIYLSDPAIRKLVSPGLKLRENRRLECSTSLRSIGHATTWRYIRGERVAVSVEKLVQDGDLDHKDLFCPDHGKYALNPDQRSARCHIHGSIEFLTPNSELQLEFITSEEKQAYDQFRSSYQNYWGNFFDPVGIQISLGETKRVETVILPLIGMTEYRDMADMFGGDGLQGANLLESPELSAFLFSAHLNHESRAFRQMQEFGNNMLARGAGRGVLGWVGNSVSMFAGDAKEVFDLKSKSDLMRQVENHVFSGQPGGVRIEVKNKILLVGFLGAMKSLLTSAAPDVRYETLPTEQGTQIIRIRIGSGFLDSVCYGLVDDSLYITLDEATMRKIVEFESARKESNSGDVPSSIKIALEEPDQPASESRATDAANKEPKSWVDGSHIALGLQLSQAPVWRQIIAKHYTDSGKKICAQSEETLHVLRNLGLLTQRSQRSFLRNAPCCPLGGSLGRKEAGTPCNHDEVLEASHPIESFEHLRAKMTFFEDGVRASIEIKERD